MSCKIYSAREGTYDSYYKDSLPPFHNAPFQSDSRRVRAGASPITFDDFSPFAPLRRPAEGSAIRSLRQGTSSDGMHEYHSAAQTLVFFMHTYLIVDHFAAFVAACIIPCSSRSNSELDSSCAIIIALLLQERQKLLQFPLPNDKAPRRDRSYEDKENYFRVWV